MRYKQSFGLLENQSQCRLASKMQQTPSQVRSHRWAGVHYLTYFLMLIALLYRICKAMDTKESPFEFRTLYQFTVSSATRFIGLSFLIRISYLFLAELQLLGQS
jgi:hypothetical protein